MSLAALASFATPYVASAISSLYQAKQNKIMQSRQMRYEQEMRDYDNEYNLPINQVMRLKEAGLNPNLAIGSLSGSVSSHLGGASGSVSAPAVPNISYLEQEAIEKANENTTADTDLKEKQGKTQEAQTKLLAAQLENVKNDSKLKRINAAIEGTKLSTGLVGNDNFSNFARSTMGFFKELDAREDIKKSHLKAQNNQTVKRLVREELAKQKKRKY